MDSISIQSSALVMNKTEFNRNFIIEFHPNQRKKWKKKLIGLDRMKELINDDVVYNETMELIKTFKSDTLWIRIRHGIAFHIRCR